MKYISTRGEAPSLSFCEAVLSGLARDGGLYVPESFPTLSPEEIADFAGRPYADVAFKVIHPFVGGEISDADLKAMVDEAYSTFRHPAVTPLVQVEDNEFILELFHGPTLAFKDVAMQLLSLPRQATQVELQSKRLKAVLTPIFSSFSPMVVFPMFSVDK